MNKNLKFLVVGVIVIAIAVTIFALNSKTKQIVAGASPDFSNSPYLTVNGVTTWYSQVAMQNGISTTTVCSFQNPNAATSTIEYLSIRGGGVPVASYTIDVGTSTGSTGTSSALVSASTLATSTTIGWIPSTFAGSQILPGQYVNFVANKLATTTGGYCLAKFIQS